MQPTVGLAGHPLNNRFRAPLPPRLIKEFMMKGTTPGHAGHRHAVAAIATSMLAASMFTSTALASAATNNANIGDGVPKAGTITRASVGSDGSQLPAGSFPPVRGGLSGDGNRVVFTNGGEGGGGGHLLPDTNGVTDAFVHDLKTGKTQTVSVNSHGEQANGGSSNPSLAYGGRHAVFESVATNLGGRDSRDNVDVFVRNLVTNKTMRVSVGRHGGQTNGNNFFPVVSGNGNIVAFQSDSSNLVKGDTNNHEDVFVRNVRTSRTSRVSLNVHNHQFKGISLEPSISASGRSVLFAMTRDGDGLANLYIRDRKAHTTRLVFNEAKHGHAIVGSWQLSANGRYVAFMTDGALVPEDTNGEFDAYRISVATGAVVRASVNSDGEQAGGVTGRVAISGDGNRVGFSTTADGYAPGDLAGISDVFVRDIAAASTFKVSVDPVGEQGNDHSGFQGYLGLSGDGSAVSFESGASNLVDGDTNDGPDVFVWRSR
jgi:Tol biopolymer transport system component